jgi:1-pyrroline-5-carboxylate dehydrogenase
VGNLYINRKITGALVGVQTFGGFKMSGTNAKAGGPDYLRLFTEMKTVAGKI